MNAPADDSALRALAEPLCNEAELRILVDQGPMGIALLDSEARFLRLNPRLVSLLGCAEEELRGRSILDVTYPDDVELERPLLADLIAGNVAQQSIEKRYVTKEGLPIWVRVVRGRVTDAAGRFRYVLAMVEDISERKAAEEMARLRTEELSTVFNSTRDALVIHTVDGRILQANDTAKRLYGMRPATNYYMADLSAPSNSMEVVQPHWRRVLDGESARFEWRARRVDDGTEFDVEVLLCRIVHEREAALLANMRDISERKRVAREIMENRGDLSRAQAVARTGSWRLDVRRNQLYWSDEAYRIFGKPKGTNLTYETFLTLVHPDDRERVDRAWQAGLRGAPYDIEHRITVDGEVRWVRERAQLEVDRNGDLAGGFGTTQDITDSKRAEEELRDSRAFVEKVMQSVGNAVYVMDAQGRFSQVNHAATLICGCAEADLLGRRMFDFIAPAVREATEAAFRGVIDRHMAICDFETQVVHKDGTLRHVILNAVPLFAEGTTCVVASGQDITARKRMEEEIRHMAQHDPLTGLPNRRLFKEIMEVAVHQADRAGTRLAIMFVDLDRFKEINDTFGHEAGDALLVQAAERLKRTVRHTDTVARVGGDEFNLVLTGIHQSERAAEVAGEIIRAFAEPFSLNDDIVVTVSSSIGISIYPEDGRDAETLIGRADRAMYAAKEEGRNTYRYFNSYMHEEASRRAREEDELRHAFERGELELYYQPQRRIDTGEIVAMEALLRWRHPKRGTLTAASFMPLAEESGLAIPIGQWVIGAACRQLAAWHQAGASARISVNLSKKQFRHPGLVETVSEALRTSGLAPGCLELEVAEETVMEDVYRSAERLRRLEQRGVRVSVDNFGTGRSSLPWLRRLPIRSVKMDKAFIHDIGTASDASAIIQAVIDLSHRLHLQAVAEGVETDEQLSFLTRHGCDEVQGYLVGAPLPARDIEPLLF